MVQFKPYSVFVHGSFANEALFELAGGIKRDQDGQLTEVAGFVRNQDWSISQKPGGAVATWLRKRVVAYSDLLPDSSTDALAYERQILACLRRIAKSITGLAILRNMKRDKKVIIVRYNSFDALKGGDCNAATADRTSFVGYVRLAFTPDQTCSSSDVSFPTSQDESLLHELFHAYLSTISNTDYYDKMKESSSVEEFLAVQITNMYRAETGRGTFQRVYGSGSEPTKQPVIVNRSELEAYYATDRDVLDALDPANLPLFQDLANYPSLPLNPFLNWHKYSTKYQANPNPARKTAP